MGALRRFALRVLHALRPSRGDGSAEREYRAHLALIEDDLLRRGLPQADARRSARLMVGTAPAVTAAHRDARGLPWVSDAWLDLRHAWRVLRRAPVHTAAVLVTVTLVVATAATVSALVHGVLLRPLPWPEPERLVRVWEQHEGVTPLVPGADLTALTYHALRDARLPSIAAIGAFEQRGHTVQHARGSERVQGAALTPSVATVLAEPPALGRFFTDEEAIDQPAAVIVISHAYWQRHFGGRRDVLGAMLVVDGNARQIVGVAPVDFAFPDHDIAIYTPLVLERPEGNSLSISSVIARLAPQSTPAQVAADATALARTTTRPMVEDVVFGVGGPIVVSVQRLDAQMTAGVRPALITLAAAVVLLLAVASANLANLSIAHGIGRRHELRIRLSLGATRRRLWRQVLVEQLGLALAGAVLGVSLGALMLGALPTLLPASFPRIADVGMDWPFVVAAATCAGLVACLSTVATVRELTRHVPLTVASGPTRAVTSGGTRLRQALLVTEAALALVLLVGAGLLLRSFTALSKVETGYDRTHTLTATLYVPAEHGADRTTAELATVVLDRLRAHAGIAAAGIGTMTPFDGNVTRWGFEMPGAAGPDSTPVMAYAMGSVITDGYVEALGMHVREGRSLMPEDRDAPVRAMLVNQTFVRTYLRDGRPAIGRRFTGMLGADNTIVEIVGVVDDVRPTQLDALPDAQLYVAFGGPFNLRGVALAVRAVPDAVASSGRLLQDIRSIVAAIDPDIPVDHLGPLDDKLTASVATPRAVMLVLVGLAAIALVLAVGGLYGVLAQTVAARSRELGIRAALGARRRTLMAMVVREGLGVTAIGLVLGLVLAGVLTRWLRSQLFGVQPLDPASFATALAVLLVAALLACLVPARHAAAANPAVTLRRADE